MKIALMQPYFFPYMGYFHLIDAVDTFYIYDNAQYISRGWINRNRILVNGHPIYITLPIEKTSRNALISDRKISGTEYERFKTKLIKQLQLSYVKAPYYQSTMQLLESILAYSSKDLTDFLHNSITEVGRHVGITTPIQRASEVIMFDNQLKGQQKTIALCKKINATEYVNPIGGRGLYDHAYFQQNNIGLHFVQSDLTAYTQNAKEFFPGLSIIDVLMNNSQEEISCFISGYSLVANPAWSSMDNKITSDKKEKIPGSPE